MLKCLQSENKWSRDGFTSSNKFYDEVTMFQSFILNVSLTRTILHSLCKFFSYSPFLRSPRILLQSTSKSWHTSLRSFILRLLIFWVFTRSKMSWVCDIIGCCSPTSSRTINNSAPVSSVSPPSSSWTSSTVTVVGARPLNLTERQSSSNGLLPWLNYLENTSWILGTIQDLQPRCFHSV